MKKANKKMVGPVRSRVALPLEGEKRKTKKVYVSRSIFIALSIVSILGFLGIIGSSFFEFDSTDYIEALLMIIVGVALMIEAQVKELKSLARGFNSNNFTRLITVIIGVVAVISGIFSFPSIRFEGSAFLAVKGILALIAIVIIVIQTWVVE